MKRLAVIPARGGSTRLKNKNIYPLGGKPLIRWTTEAVIESNMFETVLISTDSDKIFDVVADLPVRRHHRPADHSTVKATALNAMLNLMENTEELYDVFAYFLPTCPFISSFDIISGAERLTSNVDFVVSMAQIPETLQLACIMKDDWVMPITDNLECGLTNSKFIKKYYKPSGAFYMGHWNKILEHRNFFKGNVKGVLVSPQRSIDINTLMDIEYAESTLHFMRKENNK